MEKSVCLIDIFAFYFINIYNHSMLYVHYAFPVFVSVSDLVMKYGTKKKAISSFSSKSGNYVQ